MKYQIARTRITFLSYLFNLFTYSTAKKPEVLGESKLYSGICCKSSETSIKSKEESLAMISKQLHLNLYSKDFYS